MFQVNDRVTARGGVFWMTIREATESGWFSCYFGGSKNYAGRFRASELSFYFEG